MPRASLPSECVLRTMDVLLTKHTEDDVLQHVLKSKDTFYRIRDTYRPILNELLNQLCLRESPNPYRHLDWSQFYKGKEWGRISSKYLNPRFESIHDLYPNAEQCMEDKWWCINYVRDLHTCDRIFGWDATNPEFQDIHHHAKIDLDIWFDEEKDVLHYDALRFKQSKLTWEKENAEWMDTYQKQQDHKKHKTREQYEARMKEQLANRDAYQWYGGEDGYKQLHPFVDTSESCEYCKQDAIKRREYEVRLEEERKEREEREEEEKKEEEYRQQQVVQIPTLIFEPKTCECCQFTANTQREWVFHIGSKDHSTKEKLKKLYCSTCQIQCKNDADYQVHIQTQKHKKKCGELPQIFKCEACNYETNIKRNYELHCGTKKHKETTKKV